jgi:hypothetical protein
MNNEADLLASTSQKIFKELPEAPVPTFQMNDFTFYNPTNRWIKTNIPHYVDLKMTHQMTTSLAHQHGQRMSTWAHDKTPPPKYLYTRAISAHSATVQLYTRLGQLATADILRKWKKMEGNKCQLGCNMTETP